MTVKDAGGGGCRLGLWLGRLWTPRSLIGVLVLGIPRKGLTAGVTMSEGARIHDEKSRWET